MNASASMAQVFVTEVDTRKPGSDYRTQTGDRLELGDENIQLQPECLPPRIVTDADRRRGLEHGRKLHETYAVLSWRAGRRIEPEDSDLEACAADLHPQDARWMEHDLPLVIEGYADAESETRDY